MPTTHNIGEINGTIHWVRGEVPITIGGAIPGHVVGVADALAIQPQTVRVTRPSGGGLGTTKATNLSGSNVKFGRDAVAAQADFSALHGFEIATERRDPAKGQPTTSARPVHPRWQDSRCRARARQTERQRF